MEPEPARPAAPVAPARFRIAYEDEHLLVVDKPAGVVVHPGRGHARGDARAGARGPGRGRAGSRAPRRRAPVGPRHLRAARARSQRGGARGAAGRAARAGDHARVPGARRGAPAGAARARSRRRWAEIGAFALASRPIPTIRIRAVTHFETERALEDSTLLRVTLETGRTHQIRAHLLAIGHPVAGRSGIRARRKVRSLQAIPACRTARVQAPGNRGIGRLAGATAGGPGQGPPAGVRGTSGPSGVGEPGPPVDSTNAGACKNFPKLSRDQFPTPGRGLR